MKISKSILLASLLLAFTALAVSAAPAPEVIPAAAQPAAVAQPSDVFGASLLSNADCATGKSPSASLDPVWCGSCTPLACKYRETGYQCDVGPNGPVYCVAIPGMFCSIDGGARCQCTGTTP